MEFAAFTYQFTPQIEERQLDLFANTKELRDEIMQTKNQVFAEVLNSITFVYRNKTYAHKVNYSKDDITVMQLANTRTISFEKNFSKVKESTEPSCYVIIDNRESSQTILIALNSQAFTEVDTVVKILEKNFNNALQPKKLYLEITKRPQQREFWEFCEENKGKITMVRFSYKYPNVGRAAEEMRKILQDSSGKIRSSRTVVQYESDDALEINEDDEVLSGLAEDSYQGGNSIDIRLKGSKKLHQTGHTTLTVDIDLQMLVSGLIDKLKTKINEIIR